MRCDQKLTGLIRLISKELTDSKSLKWMKKYFRFVDKNNIALHCKQCGNDPNKASDSITLLVQRFRLPEHFHRFPRV